MLSKNQLGFLYMVLSVSAFSLMDVLVKWSENYPVGEVLFFRGFCGLIPIIFTLFKFFSNQSDETSDILSFF